LDQHRARRTHAGADGFSVHPFDAHAAVVLAKNMGLDRVRARNAGSPVVRATLLRPRLAIGGASQSEYVHADQPWYRLGIYLQRLSNHRSADISFIASWERRTDRCVLRACGGDRRARSFRPGDGTAGAQPDQQCDSSIARPRSKISQAA
jgi:hypothetical protein